MAEILEADERGTLAGSASKNALAEELSITGRGDTTPEMSKIKEERESLSGIKVLEVDPNSEKITFLYKDKYTITYNAFYDKDKIEVSDKNAAKPREFSFQFIYSLFGETLEEHTTNAAVTSEEDHKNKLTARLDFCVKAYNAISEKLDKDGMTLLEKKDQYVRGDKFEENKVYFAVERYLTRGEVGFMPGKKEQKQTKDYLIYNGQTSKFTKNNPTSFGDQAKIINTELQ